MTNIQIRNVPDAVHKKLKERAACAGMSLSEYLLRDLKASAERPTMEEFLQRLAGRPEVKLSVNVADILREQRGEI